jgi:hypothetical protein
VWRGILVVGIVFTFLASPAMPAASAVIIGDAAIGGNYVPESPRGDYDFSVRALSGPSGEDAVGRFSFFFFNTGTGLFGSVTCLNVSGHTATVVGIDQDSGQAVAFTIVDNQPDMIAGPVDVAEPSSCDAPVAAPPVPFVNDQESVTVTDNGPVPDVLMQRADVTQSANRPGQPTTVTFDFELTTRSGEKPSPTNGIGITVAEGITRDPGNFPTCDPAVLETQGPSGCPAASEIGSGTARFNAEPVIAAVNAEVRAFNGPNGEPSLYIVPEIGPPIVVAGVSGTSSSEFGWIFPPIPTLPDQPNASLTRMTLAFEEGYFAIQSCQQDAFAWSFFFFYEDGENLTVGASVPCTAGPPPPTGGKNPAKACKAERDQIGESAFAEKYGTDRNRRNAFGKCVSGGTH